VEIAQLGAAYDVFLRVAERSPQGTAENEWGASTILAHITINNRLIAGHVARVLDKEPRPYDNIPAQSEHLLRAVVASNRGWGSLVGAARRSCEEVLALAELISDDMGGIQQHVLVLDGDHALVDGDVAVADMLGVQAHIHLPAHTEQLQGLV